MNTNFSRIKVRFAPSPTGFLHVGNIRIALINYLYAKKNDGVFVLRIDDTDLERSTKEYEENIFEDLNWLGLKWDELYKQSDNISRYDQAIEFLKSKGRVYECYETKEELALKRKIQASKGIPPVYDRAALNLTDAEKAALKEKGIKPYFRFKLNQDDVVSWNDLIHKEISIPLNSVSDPVLIKPDGGYAYTFASVVDDIDMKISTIIRGDDHITNTAVQIDIFKAICGYTPEFAHIPLMLALDGQDISKRTKSVFSISAMRKSGIYSQAILNVLATLGTPNSVENDSLEDLISKLNLSKMSLSTIKFSLKDVVALNKKIISEKEFEEVESQIQELNISISKDFWDTCKNNLEALEDLLYWRNVIDGDFCADAKFNENDKNFLKTSYDEISENFDFVTWIETLKKITGRKGKALFHPIRLALTGIEKGPELNKICNLIGIDEVKKRIKSAC